MGKLETKKGSVVYHAGERFEILEPISLKEVLARNAATGTKKVLPISELKSASGEDASSHVKTFVEHIKKEYWDQAKKRYDIIKPLLESSRTRKEVEKRAKEFGLSADSLYRWIRTYETTGLISSLAVRYEQSGAKGKHRTDEATDAIIVKNITEKYLTSQRHSVKSVYESIKKECRNAKIPVPHINTVRNRIKDLSHKKVLKDREGVKKSEDMFRPIESPFPEGRFPLDVVQIDHSHIDLILTSEVDRQPVDRPWLTIAIDVYSRTVFGFYLSFEPPSFFTVGQCLANGILQKEGYLRSIGVEGEWNVWGVPGTVHADNAMEFRGLNLQRVCEEYGVSLVWRPVAKPQYGAHIERLIGTLNKAIHELPGTTFSNVKERGEYDSATESSMTLSEFEKWFAGYVVNVYHRETHSALGMSPIQKYEEGIFGDGHTLGRGLPDLIEDEDRLRISLLPSVERSIQQYGVKIERIQYYSDVLREWIKAKEDGKVRKFTFKVDLRDISEIYFYDPSLKEYFSIPYRNIQFPKISIWEKRKAEKYLKDKKIKEYDEYAIFEAHEILNKIKRESVEKTKAVRREQASKSYHKKKLADIKSSKANTVKTPDKTAGANENTDPIDALFSNVKPFKGISLLKNGGVNVDED